MIELSGVVCMMCFSLFSLILFKDLPCLGMRTIHNTHFQTESSYSKGKVCLLLFFHVISCIRVRDSISKRERRYYWFEWFFWVHCFLLTSRWNTLSWVTFININQYNPKVQLVLRNLDAPWDLSRKLNANEIRSIVTVFFWSISQMQNV